jgi:hypothetical protein
VQHHVRRGASTLNLVPSSGIAAAINFSGSGLNRPVGGKMVWCTSTPCRGRDVEAAATRVTSGGKILVIIVELDMLPAMIEQSFFNLLDRSLRNQNINVRSYPGQVRDPISNKRPLSAECRSHRHHRVDKLRDHRGIRKRILRRPKHIEVP